MPTTMNALKAVAVFGEVKLSKYGEDIIQIVKK